MLAKRTKSIFVWFNKPEGGLVLRRYLIPVDWTQEQIDAYAKELSNGQP